MDLASDSERSALIRRAESEPMTAMLETVSPVLTAGAGPGHSAAKLFDRAGLREKIAALHSDGGSADGLRRHVIALFRSALDNGRAIAREALEANGRGLTCAGQLAHIEDELIKAVHHYVVTYVHPPEEGAVAAPCVIAAVGGYGRATLAPGSDIDLLFLLSADAQPRTQSVVQAVLYVLWDLGQKVGHSPPARRKSVSSRRVPTITVRTALLEARFILGDATLFETMRARFEREIVHGSAAEFVAAKLAERDARIARAGRSRYLVEPHVKDGKGGLRDLNTLF